MQTPVTSSEDPRQIADFLLQETGMASQTGDFSRFQICFHLPNAVETMDGKRVIRSALEMRNLFERVRAYHQQHGVTDVVRRIVTAQFQDAATIHAIHESRLLSGAIQVHDVYQCFSELRRFDDRWKIVSSQYAIADSPVLNKLLAGAKSTRPKTDPSA